MITPSERPSHRIRAARASRRPPRLGVTILAFAVLFAVAWAFFLRSDASTPTATIKAVQGTYTWRSGSPSEDGDGTFSAVASGNAGGTAELAGQSVRSGSGRMGSAYDAAERTQMTVGGVKLDAPRSSVTIGAWPPVWHVATHSPLEYQGLAAVVRSAVADRDASVGIKPLRDGDRKVWRAAMTMNGKALEVVVDQLTGIVTWYSAGRATFTADVAWASPPPVGKTYTVDVPEGTAVKTIAGGPAYAAAPAEAARTAGYEPLVSDLAPDGYSLRAIATAPAELRPVSWISDMVWSLPTGLPGTATLQLYTLGLAQFTVEQVGPVTLRSLDDLPDWEGEARAGKLSFQETTLQYGAFKGASASTWYQESGPSLLVAGRRRAVFVTGALTRAELISFAEGLKPLGEARAASPVTSP